MPHHWCQQEKWCSIFGVSRRSSAPLLASVGVIVLIVGIRERNSALSLVSLRGMCPIDGVSLRNSALFLVSNSAPYAR